MSRKRSNFTFCPSMTSRTIFFRGQDKAGNRGGYQGRKSDYGKKWDQWDKKKTPIKNETETPVKDAFPKEDPKPVEAPSTPNVNGGEAVNVPPPETPPTETKAEGEEAAKPPKISQYVPKPNEKKFSGRCRLFVANLPNTTTEDELREMFTQYGETGELFINKDKGFAFIRLVSFIFKILLYYVLVSDYLLIKMISSVSVCCIC